MEERRNTLLRIALIMAIIAALFAFRLPPIDHSAGKAGGVYDGSGTELSPETVHALPEAMTFTSEENAITVKATVKPDTIRNKSVDWIVDFENPAATWAKGKTASDYVSVTPESDGAATAKVRCLKSFGERIVIKVISRADPDVSAQCKVDYYGKADSVQLYFRLGNADEEIRKRSNSAEERRKAANSTTLKMKRPLSGAAGARSNVRTVCRRRSARRRQIFRRLYKIGFVLVRIDRIGHAGIYKLRRKKRLYGHRAQKRKDRCG